MSGLRQQLDTVLLNLPDAVTSTTSAEANISQSPGFAVSAVYTVDTPTAKTFVAGVAEVGTITFETLANTDAGDYVVLYAQDGTAYAIAADVTGTDPAPTGAVYTAISAAQKALVDLSAETTAAEVAAAFVTAFNALAGFSAKITLVDNADGTVTYTCATRGVSTNSVTKDATDATAGSIVAAVTTQGIDSTVSTTAETITIASHGLTTGLKGQLTSSGTLPAGLSTATDYFVIVVDANTIQLATSLANALVGTAINITNQGTSAATHTFTATALAGCSVKLQSSCDGLNWFDISGESANITATGSTLFEVTDAYYHRVRAVFIMTAGRVVLSLRLNAK